MYTVFLILAFFSASSAPQDATAPPERVGKEMCLACHDVAATLHATPHAAKECEDCHGAGSAHVEAGGDMSPAFRTKSVSWGVAQCQSCHGDAENELASFRFSPHGKNEIACISCHKIHGEKPRFGLLADQTTELCGSCHQSTRAAFRKPYHHPVLEGGMNCISCHVPHYSTRSSLQRETGAGEAGCVSCHPDKQGPFVFEHAAAEVNGCQGCHQPHGSFNSKLLNRSQVYQLCLECHSMTPDVATAQPPAFHDLRSPRYRNCTVCHREIHGSNVSPVFLR